MNENVNPTKNERILTLKQVFGLSTPCLIIYCLIGMPNNGKWFLEAINASAAVVEVGQYIWNFIMVFILLLLIPATIIKKKFNIPLSSIGTQKGDWNLGKKLLLVGLIAIPLLYFGSNDPELINEYPLSKSVLGEWYFFIIYEILYGLLYYTAYEFFFRGLMQIGSNKHWNIWIGITIVTAITTFIHWIPMHKPMSEIIGAFAIGFVFGYFAEKTHSWYYIFAIHFGVGVITDIYCGLRFLGVL